MLVLTDFLIWALVAFPLLTGGVWIARPGMKLELTEPAAPVVLIVLAIGLIAWRRRDLEWVGRLTSVRFFTGLWKSWQREFASRPWDMCWTGVGIVGSLWSIVALRRHWAGESEAFDLGIFTQAMWSFTHGHGWVSSLKDGVSLFSDHQSPIFLIFAPFFYLFPHPETLLVLQAFALATGAVACVILVKQESVKQDAVKPGSDSSQAVSLPWLPAALPLLYWAYPAVRAANAFDFHPEVLMLPLFLFAIAGLQSARMTARVFGALAFLAALGCKESAGPVACGIALAWVMGAGPAATRVFTRRMSFVAGALGLVVFLVDVMLVPKWAGASGYAYGGAYSYLRTSHSVGEWTHALPVWPRLRFLFFLFLPLGLLPLFGKRVRLWASAPGLLMLFLSEGDHRLKTIFHYGIEPSIGLFWAAASAQVLTSAGSTRVSCFTSPLTFLNSAKCAAVRLGWTVVVLAIAAHGRSEIFRIRKYEPAPHMQWVRTEIVPTISPTVSLAATSGWVPHLATREWVHFFPEIKMPGGKSVDCIFLDSQGDNWPIGASEAEARAKQLVAAGEYREVWNCEAIRILQRVTKSDIGAPAEQCWTSRPTCTSGPGFRADF